MAQQKKLPKNLSLDELLQAIENPEDTSVETVIDEPDSDVMLFITTLKIGKGNDRVKRKLLYKLYSEWSKTPTTKVSFSVKLSYYFDFVGEDILIDDNTFSVTNRVKRLLAPKKDYTKNPNLRRHIEYFLNKFKIKNGLDMRVQGYILYYIYDNWNYKNRSRNRLGTNRFNKLVGLYVNHNHINNSNKMFYLHKDIKETLTPEYLAKAREWGKARYKHLTLGNTGFKKGKNKILIDLNTKNEKKLKKN